MKKKSKIETQKLETKHKFDEWAFKVKERDGNKCVICGATKYVQSHHLIPRENKSFRFDIDNGISLCTKHHKFSLEISPHRNALTFLFWLEHNKSEQLKRLKQKIDNEFKINE